MKVNYILRISELGKQLAHTHRLLPHRAQMHMNYTHISFIWLISPNISVVYFSLTPKIMFTAQFHSKYPRKLPERIRILQNLPENGLYLRIQLVNRIYKELEKTISHRRLM